MSKIGNCNTGCIGSNYYTKIEVDILLNDLKENIINDPKLLEEIKKIIDKIDFIDDIKLTITNKTEKKPAVILTGKVDFDEES